MLHKSNKRKLRLKVNSLENLISYLTKLKDANISSPSLYVLNDDEYLKNSINDFYENQLKKLEMNHGFKIGHQELDKVNEKIINQRKDLLIYIQNTISALESEIKVEIGEITYYESLVKKIPISERDMASIQRKLKINEKLYDFLLEKRASTSIAKSGIVPQTKIIEKARTVGKVGGKSNQNIIIFIIIGFSISLLISIISRIFFEKIQQVKELADSTTVPVLGGIPFLKNFNLIMDIKIRSKDNFVESLRAIRTSMNFLLTSKNKTNFFKSFLITSIHPGEGKTFSTINIARIFASSGKKVLIVDFDMHKPKVHKELLLTNNIGNSTNLSKKSDFKDSINEIEKDLFVISSGPVPPNPSELALSENVKELFNFAENNFDYLFIDTPPTGLITDALVLSSVVDHSIFVMNVKFANKKGLKFIEETVQKSNIKSTLKLISKIR